jgi:hypothetical protein
MFAINKTTSNAPPVAVAQPRYQQLPSDALHFGGFVPVSAGTPVGGRVHDALGIDEVTASLLHATDTYTIMQRPSLTEGLCPACERSNIYDVYDAVTGMHLFIAKERSDCVPRYCCAPYHSLFLELKGAAGLNPMLSHMVDVDTLGTVLTLERPGCMLPKPCLCCVACSDPCKDGMYLHAGALPADASAGGIRTTNPRCVGFATQPFLAGGWSPTLTVMERQPTGLRALATVKGPCLFGGCLELCRSTKFSITPAAAVGGHLVEGSLGRIVKRKPTDLAGNLREAVTDADVYTLELPPAAQISAHQKALLLSTLLLADYMFFERDGACCDANGCTLCLVHCGGCLFPCTLRGSGRGRSAGAGVGGTGFVADQ